MIQLYQAKAQDSILSCDERIRRGWRGEIHVALPSLAFPAKTGGSTGIICPDLRNFFAPDAYFLCMICVDLWFLDRNFIRLKRFAYVGMGWQHLKNKHTLVLAAAMEQVLATELGLPKRPVCEAVAIVEQLKFFLLVRRENGRG